MQSYMKSERYLAMQNKNWYILLYVWVLRVLGKVLKLKFTVF